VSHRKSGLYGSSDERDALHGWHHPLSDYTGTMHIPHPTPLRLALLVALLATAWLPAQAQWMWRDKDGRVTASDLPPPRDIGEKDILQRPDLTARKPPPAASAAVAVVQGGKAPADPQLESRRRAAEQDQQAKAKADDDKLAQQRTENCRRARGHLTALEGGQRIARTNDKGEREVLDDKGRAEEMRRANDVVASDCR